MSASIVSVAIGDDIRGILAASLADAKRDNLFAPVTVLAPTMRAATQLRHDLARSTGSIGHRGIANVRFTVMSRLAELMGAPVLRGKGLRQLDRNSLGAAVRAELAEHKGFLTSAAHHPSTESEIVHFYEEVRYLTDAARAQLGALGREERELIGVIDGVRQRLFPIAYDDVDLFAAASAAAANPSSRATFGKVIVHFPQRLRTTELQFVAALAQCGLIDIHVACFGAADSDPIGDKMLQDLHSALDIDLSVPHGEVPKAVLHRATMTTFDRLVVSPDHAGEVREAVAIVRERLSTGARPERLGVSYARSVPYLRLLAQELNAAKIPWNGPSCDVLRAAPSCQFLLQLLNIASGELARSALVDLLASSAVRDKKDELVPVGEWQRCSRLTGLVGGDERTWHSRLRSLIEEASSERAHLDEAISSSGTAGSAKRRSERASRTVDACRGLDQFLRDLFVVTGEFRQATTHERFVQVAKRMLDQFIGPEEWRTDQLFPLGDQETSLLAVLDELALLDDIQKGATLLGFSSALDVALSRPGPSNGRNGLGVVVGDISAFAGIELDCLVVAGCAEGDLPGSERPSPLLSSKSRELVGLELENKPTVIARDERRLAAALLGAREKIALSPSTDAVRGRRRLVSRFVGSDALKSEAGSWVASLNAIADCERAASNLDELFCADLFAASKNGESLKDHPVVEAIDHLEHGIYATSSRDHLVFDRFSGRVSHLDLGDVLFAESFSPTTLERYATCPFRYFVAHELSCEVIDVPELRLAIDARVRGTMAHEILERYYGEQLKDEIESDLSTDAGAIGSGERLLAIADEVISRYERLGMTGRKALWEPDRRRLVVNLLNERQSDLDQREHEGFRPIVVEHSFGATDSAAPVAVTISSGPLFFRGKIDRIDANDAGDLRVLDYKTGRSDGYRALRDDPVDRGRHLQLPVYAAAAHNDFAAQRSVDRPTQDVAVDARFRFVGRDEDVSYVLSEKNANRFAEVLDTVVTSIRSGLFPMHPGATSRGGNENCQWCDFDAICPSDRSRRWEKVRADQNLLPYVQLCEGSFIGNEDKQVP